MTKEPPGKKKPARRNTVRRSGQDFNFKPLRKFQSRTGTVFKQEEQRKMALILQEFMKYMEKQNQVYFQERHPRSAANIRSYSIDVLLKLSDVLGATAEAKRRRFYSKDKAPDRLWLTAGLEALAVELAEVNAGKKSSLFNPKGADSTKVRLSVRAAAAATLHIIVGRGLTPVDVAAQKISQVLFEESIFRVDAETHERTPIPIATIVDWRKDRDSHSEEYNKLFRRCIYYIGSKLKEHPDHDRNTEKEIAEVLDQLTHLIRAFAFS